MTRRVEPIPVDECLALLERGFMGRIAFIQDGMPQVLPVNYRFHHGMVVMRTDYGGFLDAVHQAPVAFEIDAIDEEHHTGWSVVVHGTAEEAWRPEELAVLRDLPLRPWAPGTRDHYVRILSREITGRRIT